MIRSRAVLGATLWASSLLPSVAAAQAPPPSPPPPAPVTGTPAAAAPAAPGAYAPPPSLAPTAPPAYAPRAIQPPQMIWRPRTKLHSPGLMGGGIALVSIGTLALIGGMSVFVEDAGSHGEFSGAASLIIGLPLTIVAVGCLAAGIPMTVIGAKQEPDPEAPPALVPAVVSARNGAALRWTF